MTGAWLLPTLGRPHQLKEFFASYMDTKSVTPVWVLIDNTDAKMEEYESLVVPDICKIIKTSGITMADKINEVWNDFINFEWVGIINDDHRPRTPNWDQTIISQINGSNIIGTNDGPTTDKPWKAPNKLCGATCFSTKILRTLGWMWPPGCKHLFIDDAWEQLGSKAGCIQILMDVCVEHVHALKTGVKDETHDKVYGEHFDKGLPGDRWKEDEAAYKAWLTNGFQDDLNKLMAIQPKQGLMVATPSHDGTCSMMYAVGLSDLAVALSMNNVYFELARVSGSSLIPHARNSLVDMFLKSKCQKLLFVDSDQGWDKMSAWILFQSSRRLIAGITPHKRFPINMNFEPLDKDRHYFNDMNNKGPQEVINFARGECDQRGEVEVNRAGTGFMMIDRSVFEIMSPNVDKYYPFDGNDKIKHEEFFKFGISKTERYKGEDWHFTELAKSLHIPIFINVNSVVDHSGMFTFSVRGGQ